MNNLKIILTVFLIVVVTFISFYPALKNNFTNWDDDSYVTENKVIRYATLKNINSICTSFFITHYQPLTIFSFLLEYHFFRLNPFNYHLDNIILHLLNCLLVFWVIFVLTGNVYISGITTILFGVHPIQVESVAWVSERKNLLYAFFFLGSILSYLYYLKKNRAFKYYSFCLFLFILSLLSKSMAITLPLVLFILDYVTGRKINKFAFIDKIPYFILSIIFGWIAIFGANLSKSFYDLNSYDLFTRLKGISYDIIFYLTKLFFPVRLSTLYPYVDSNDNLFYANSFFIIIILLIFIFIFTKYTKKVIFGVSFFSVMIFPAIRFLPQETMLVADRYAYLPAIGIFYLFAEGFIWLYRRKIQYWRLLGIFLIFILMLLVISLGFSTWKRTQVWKNDSSLWSDVLKKYPTLHSAYNKRGEYFLSQKDYVKANLDFMQAIDISNKLTFNPAYRYYYLNLGNSLRALGKDSAAIAVFEKLISQAETYLNLVKTNRVLSKKNEIISTNRRKIEAEAYFNLANMNEQLDNKKAITLYTRAIEIYPGNVNAHYYLSDLYVKLNRKEEARQELLKAIEIDPTYILAYFKIAQIYKDLSQRAELELLYRKAIANNLDYFDAYYYIGNLYVDIQRDKDAILLYKRAVKIKPDSKEAYLGLGNAYLTVGQNKEAIICLEKALKLDPHLAVVHNNIALAYYYANNYNLAIKHCDQAIRLGYAVNPKLLDLLKLKRK